MKKIFKSEKWGFVFSVFLTLIIIVVFFKPVLQHPDKVLFSTTGDGIHSYYIGMFHSKYDNQLFHTQSLNYPYGENVFLTDSQPLVSNFIKLIKPVWDISDYSIGIINLLMLSGLLLASLFLYLIFIKLEISPAVSLIYSIAITFLSPQLNRFGGHYSLSYVFIIPMVIYFILRYNRKPSFKLSIIIVCIGIILAGTHFYHYAFYAIIVFFYHLNYFLIHKNDIKDKKLWFNAIFQVFAPIVLYLVLMHFTDTVEDRLQHPWGFFYSRAYPESVFLPLHKPYLRFITNMNSWRHVKWEGMQYVGLIATCFFLTLVYQFALRIIKKKYKITLYVSKDISINFLLWSGLFALLYSWGIPFIFGLESLVEHLGIIGQVRSIGRFVWVFYFSVNILTVYFIYHRFKQYQNLKWKLILGISILIVCLEAFSNVKTYSKGLDNSFNLITDYNNELPENAVLKNLDIDKYQSVIPLPYFNIGSENIQAVPNSQVYKYAFWLSLKTGLPNTGMFSARSSLSQPLHQVSMFTNPSNRPEILELHDKNKGYLIIADTTYQLNETSSAILQASHFLTKVDNFILSEISYSDLCDTYKQLFEKVVLEKKYYDKENKENQNALIHAFIYMNTDTLFPAFAINTLFKDTLPDTMSDTIAISFWMCNMNEERFPQSRVEINLWNQQNSLNSGKNVAFRDHIVAFDNNYALFEYILPVGMAKYLELKVFNQKMKNDSLHVQNVLIRNIEVNVFEESETYIYKNNKAYRKYP